MSLRKTQNVITHVTQPGTKGTGAGHDAEDVAFDPTGTDLESVTVQDALAELAALIAAIPAAPEEL